jgi:hypothetical protein
VVRSVFFSGSVTTISCTCLGRKRRRMQLIAVLGWRDDLQLLQLGEVRTSFRICREFELWLPAHLVERQVRHDLLQTPSPQVYLVLRDIGDERVVDQPTTCTSG